MKQVVKDVSFAVLTFVAVVIGLPLLAIAGAFIGMIFQFVIPALFGVAILRAIWLIPGAIKYRVLNGEWHFQTVAHANGYRTGMTGALQAERDRKQFQAYRMEQIKDLTRH